MITQHSQSSPKMFRFFDGNNAALNCITQALETAQQVRIATAYFEGSGYQALQEVLGGKKIRLLVGRQEGGEDNLREVLNEFLEELSYGQMENRTRAMRQMLDALERGWMAVSVGAALPENVPWMEGRYLYHHAKLYIADESAAVVTSANFSYQGLCISREAGITITDPDDVIYFVQQFDYYFEKAHSITAELIEALKAYLGAYDPYTIYARALLELYGLPQDDAPAQLPPLAEYQKGVASSVLRSLMEHDGCFLIASTGLGKTVIAAHVAAYLRMQEEIDSVLVICPAGLRQVWRRQMRAAKLSVEEFSYHTLTRTEGDSNLPNLERELKQVNEQTLVVLDESHRLRNEEMNGGDLRLSNERIQKAVREKGAKALLLTATPYGKAFAEVESQLKLLPAPKEEQTTHLGLATRSEVWQAEHLADLPELPICTVLTTPDVVRHFSQRDETGERFVVFSANDRRYFPRCIRLKSIRFENPFDEFFADLLESKLLYKKVERPENPRQDALPMDFPEPEGERLPLQEALFLHEFCSSPAEVDGVCNKLIRGEYNYAFARQKELSQFVRDHRDLVRKAKMAKYDTKLQELAKIIGEAGQDKVVIFCEYLETASYLYRGLQKLTPHVSVATTVDSGNLDELIQHFAPIANEVLPEDRDPAKEIQVLIATRSMAEGFNLQDACVLVNYDLPWTVLQLAQRMGRILRPWSVPRDVMIYNFLPSSMDHERIRHARNWHSRLQERSRVHRSLAQIPVLVHRESQKTNQEQAFEMETLGREMLLAHDDTADMDLNQVMEFIQSVEEITTSTFYKDLATIPNRDEILELPAGIRSATVTSGQYQKQLFLLLRRGRNHVDTVLADAHGRPLDESRRKDDVMRIIRCLPDTPKAPFDIYPSDDEFDRWIERSRNQWAEQNGLEPGKLKLVCALALLPKINHRLN